MAGNEEVLHFVPRVGVTRQPLSPPFQVAPPTVDRGSVNFLARRLPDRSYIAVSHSGDHVFLSEDELNLLNLDPFALPLTRQAELQARFFLPPRSKGEGVRRLLSSRRLAKRETIEDGPSLHIIVPTLHCGHSCKYCQVSRSLDDQHTTMTTEHLDTACDAVFESEAASLTVEFQGGDPLLRFDLVERAIRRLSDRNRTERRNLRIVIASTLHQLTPEMCTFFHAFGVVLSTSVDGPEWLHNKNRPVAGRDAYSRTLAGIALAKTHLGNGAVSALMTTTRLSLQHPEAIVDEYVRLGFQDIFLRPLSIYGFAKRNLSLQAYSLQEFTDFYRRALERILYWNRKGVTIREVYASIVLNKILSTFDGGYVDLQNPTGAGTSVLVYNYDGYVYPSDEARMLLESGDKKLRLGRIGLSQSELLASPVRSLLIEASTIKNNPACGSCAYNQFCGPNPIDSYAQHENMFAPVLSTEHCQRHMWLFDEFFVMLRTADDFLLDVFHQWAMPPQNRESTCVDL